MLDGYVCDLDICEKTACYEKKTQLLKKRKAERLKLEREEGKLRPYDGPEIRPEMTEDILATYYGSKLVQLRGRAKLT
jgi:hypothetical protein